MIYLDCHTVLFLTEGSHDDSNYEWKGDKCVVTDLFVCFQDEIGDFLGIVLTSMNSNSGHNRNDSSDMDEVDVRKKKRKRSVSRDLSSEMERSVGKQALTSQASAKKSTPQKASVQDHGKTLLKLPLGNTMGAISTVRSLSQPSPAKKPRTSKSKSKAANPPPSIIHVTGAAPTTVVSSVPQAIPVHPGALQGFPLPPGATVTRQVPLPSASAAALASTGRGQTFISLTPKSSDPGTRVTQTFITIPRGSSPSVMPSSSATGQTVQYIIKPQSQRHTPVNLSAVGAALSAQGGVVPSGAQLPVRTIVSAPVRQTPLSQSPSSSFTSVVSLKGTAVTTQAPSFPSGAVPASNASLAAASSLGKFPPSSAVLTSARPTFTRVSEMSQPSSTINVLTKDGNKLVVSQAISSAGLKGSYKLVSGATLQTVSNSGGGQSQVVFGHPVRSASSGSQGLVTHKVSAAPGSVATSLPVSLAALAGKLPSSTTMSQPGGRVTLVQSTRPTAVPTQSVRTLPGQTVTMQRSVVSRPNNPQTGVATSLPGAVTVARAGTTQVTRVISSGSPITKLQTGTAFVASKTLGYPVACSQVTPKAAPTFVVSSAAVSGTKVVPSPQISSVFTKTTMALTAPAQKPALSQTVSTTTSASLGTTPGQQIVKSVPATQVAVVGQSPAVAPSEVKEQTPVAPKSADSAVKEATTS